MHISKNAVKFTLAPQVNVHAFSIAARLIRTLSALWSGELPGSRRPWIDGEIVVPSENEKLYFISRGDVAKETGYRIDTWGNTDVVGAWSKENARKRVVPNLTDLCARKKWPAFVEFDEVGYNAPPAFARGLELAAELVSQGYIGGLHCYSGCLHNEKYSNPERCIISVSKSWVVGVNLRWDEDEFVGPILALCKAEKFEEKDGWEEYEIRDRRTA